MVPSLKKVINYGLGVLLAIWVSIVIYRQLRAQPNFDQALMHVKDDWTQKQVLILLATFLLMLVNWGIEALKWRALISNVEKISFYNSVRSVFTGISVSLLTPNRIGEYAGRILYLKNVNKGQAIVANIVGSVLQFIVAAIFGLIGIIVFWQYAYYGFMGWLLVGTVVAIIVLILALLRLKDVPTMFNKNKYLKRLSQYLRIVGTYSTKTRAVIATYSALRYVVFGTQFYLLLMFFDASVPYLIAMPVIYLIFWCMAVLPSIALAEAPMRTELSILFLGQFNSNHLGIMTASLSLWLLNVILPALLGALSIIGLRIIEQFNDE